MTQPQNHPIKYPVGMQDFAAIREEGFLYVDKTARMYEMVRDHRFVFFARPRRFGKTLLVNTLAAYFSGRRELFKGLAVEKLETEWNESPVLRFNMSMCNNCDVSDIPSRIASMLEWYEAKYQFPVNSDCCSNGDRFRRLIRNVYNKLGAKVVVIIDEYDSPILDRLYDDQKDEVGRILREFYYMVKMMEECERFVYITGITKPSNLGIFEDLSMDDRFSDLCGFTVDEVRDNFGPGIEAMAAKHGCASDEMFVRLVQKYEGYHFSESSRSVLNPVSVVEAVSSGELDSFWFKSGSSVYLANQLMRFNENIMDIERDVFRHSFYVPLEQAENCLPVLYQSGYLTIGSYDPDLQCYTLKFPNQEVRVGMSAAIMKRNASIGHEVSTAAMRGFYFSLVDGDVDSAFGYLQDYFTTIPYTLNNKTEKHYQTILYVIMTWLGFYTQVEVSNAVGRLDVVLFLKDRIFIMEFKVDQSAEQALEQINKMRYAAQYENEGRPIVKIGINIDSAARTVEKWVVEQ